MIENQRFTGSVADHDKQQHSLSYRGKVWMMIAAGYAVSTWLLYWPCMVSVDGIHWVQLLHVVNPR